jgi:hypothetical protein
MAEIKDDGKTPSQRIDEAYGYEEPEEEEEEKSIAQQMIEAIKARREKMFSSMKKTV